MFSCMSINFFKIKRISKKYLILNLVLLFSSEIDINYQNYFIVQYVIKSHNQYFYLILGYVKLYKTDTEKDTFYSLISNI